MIDAEWGAGPFPEFGEGAAHLAESRAAKVPSIRTESGISATRPIKGCSGSMDNFTDFPRHGTNDPRGHPSLSESSLQPALSLRRIKLIDAHLALTTDRCSLCPFASN
jgi:hypothetical protein